MISVSKQAGRVVIQLDERHYFVSSTLHNKIELFIDSKYSRDFTNLCSAFEYYWNLVENKQSKTN